MYGVEESKLLVKELDLVNTLPKNELANIWFSVGFQKFDQPLGHRSKSEQNYGTDTGVCGMLWGQRKQVCWKYINIVLEIQ